MVVLLLVVPKKFTLSNKTKITPTPVKQENTTEVKSFSITAPENNFLVQGDSVEISGTAPEKSVIVLSGPSEDKVVKIANDNKFSVKLSVYEGENLITVTSYLPDNTTKTESRTIFATKAEL